MAPTRPRMLVTAGNTLTPIDAVRGVTNVFSGRTGARIAAEATIRGYDVQLLTSQPGVVGETTVDDSRLTSTAFQTFDDLAGLMEDRVRNGGFDVIVHSAAVSDYLCAAVFEPAPDVTIAADGAVLPASERVFRPVAAATKISSRHSELWLRLVPTTKLVDQIRRPWGFTGVLVKFKLEVGIDDDELIRRAQSALVQSEADLVVANTFESRHDRAFFVTRNATQVIERQSLPSRLIDLIDDIRATRSA